MAKLHLSSPWQIYYREVEELFRHDENVHVVYDEAENHLKLYVDGVEKAAALERLMPTTKIFGTVKMRISVIPANDITNAITPRMNFVNDFVFEAVFNGNDAFSFAKTIPGIFTNNLTYVVFKNRVVQYFNDDLGDIYGQCSTLYQEIAKDVFGETEGIFYCTDKVECVHINMPQKDEWP